MIASSKKHYTNIAVNNVSYPVYIDGNGTKPCLCIGIGSLMQKTLSANFKTWFTTYATDLYWIHENRLPDCSTLTMQQIITDIHHVMTQLALEKPIILAHSAYGIVALELAKNSLANISGIIMVGSPPAWNDKVITFARNYFDTQASHERKENDKQRKERFQKMRKPGESDISINAYEADTARYWGNYQLERAFLEALWQGSEADDAVMNHFFCHILPQHDLSHDIDKINVPVLLAAGQLDFDCVPLSLWDQHPKPSQFTMIDCGAVGHWPNLENATLFDREVINWSNTF